MMKALRFDAALPWTPKPLYDWFRDTVGQVIFVADDGTSHEQGGVVVVYVGKAPTSTKWANVAGTISGLIHETRHIEVGPHPCGTIDIRISDLGAFGVHNLFFTWLGRHADPAVQPLEYRKYFLFIACQQSFSAFCNETNHSCQDTW